MDAVDDENNNHVGGSSPRRAIVSFILTNIRRFCSDIDLPQPLYISINKLDTRSSNLLTLFGTLNEFRQNVSTFTLEKKSNVFSGVGNNTTGRVGKTGKNHVENRAASMKDNRKECKIVNTGILSTPLLQKNKSEGNGSFRIPMRAIRTYKGQEYVFSVDLSKVESIDRKREEGQKILKDPSNPETNPSKGKFKMLTSSTNKECNLRYQIRVSLRCKSLTSCGKEH